VERFTNNFSGLDAGGTILLAFVPACARVGHERCHCEHHDYGTAPGSPYSDQRHRGNERRGVDSPTERGGNEYR
jgi:hypothetical protein